MNRRRALILSGRFGKGHDTVAEASATVLESIDVASQIIDCIGMLGGPGSQIGERVFRTILDQPPIYDAFHFNQLRPGRWLARRLDDASLRVMWARFAEVCDQFRPDLLLSVFASGAAAASRYKAEHPDVKTAVFITDAAAHAMWVHAGTDVFMVPSMLGELAVRRYQAGAHVCHVTHPTRPAFYNAPSRSEARANLGVPSDARCVLLMSGAWGVGPVAPCAQALAKDGAWVLAVAGSNARLASRLRRLAGHQPRIIPFGFSDRVPELMAASDVVVSAPGDTCREARVVGRGLVLFDAVPGHGRENLMHELESGNAWVATPEPAALVTSVRAFLADPSHRNMPPVDPALWEDEFRVALASIGLR